jgi:hypothetical protein
MGIPTTQIPVEFGGKKYSGIYSVSGTTLIARIPGLSSRSAIGFDGEPEAEARALFEAILKEAESQGRL